MLGGWGSAEGEVSGEACVEWSRAAKGKAWREDEGRRGRRASDFLFSVPFVGSRF